ncbi:MAG TPA: fimbria/pilus periplasmic chaperone [Burkholderiales bacterium]|nr:fimbria/pilus periplasmic chaperone [Burkholderiales bacterium]
MTAARAGCFSLLLMITGLQPALAGVFSVTPVRIYMTPRDRAVAVTITNEGEDPIVLQADTYVWTQKADGSDELTPTEDLILAPPILKLGSKARQVVRLARLKPADATHQLTYRMILREIPEAAGSKNNVQVAIALALSMPVFITPPLAKAEVACDAKTAPAGTDLDVGCANTGSAYAQMREILVKEKNGERALGRFEGGVYVLPGARKIVPVKIERPGAAAPLSGALQLTVTFDDGRVQTFDVTVGPPRPGQ